MVSISDWKRPATWLSEIRTVETLLKHMLLLGFSFSATNQFVAVSMSFLLYERALAQSYAEKNPEKEKYISDIRGSLRSSKSFLADMLSLTALSFAR